MRLSRTSVVAIACIILLIFAILPTFLSSYYLGLIVLMLIFGIFAMSLDILMGYCGLPSLGHAACFGVAAYTAGFLALNVFKNFWLEALTGVALSLVIAGLFGLLALRTRGINFMMITLALSTVLWGIAFKWTSVTHGDDGLKGIRKANLLLVQIDSYDATAYYYFALIVFIVATIIIFRLMHSPFGLILKGIRDSETRMRAMGYNTWAYQYTAFVLAGFFAAIAGVLDVYYRGFVGPDDLHIIMSAKVLLMVILGGAGTLIGPIVGAFTIVLLENFISGYTSHWLLVLGITYMAVILLAPKGVYRPVKRKVQKWLSPQAR